MIDNFYFGTKNKISCFVAVSWEPFKEFLPVFFRVLSLVLFFSVNCPFPGHCSLSLALRPGFSGLHSKTELVEVF